MKIFLLFWLLFVFDLLGVTLEWDANSESNLAGYRVYTGRQSRAYDTVLDVGNVTLAQLATAPGTTYYAVTAYDSDGLESDFSDEVSYTAPNSLRSFVWRLPSGRIQIENTLSLVEPIVWTPIETVDGPRDYTITVDIGVPQRYFRYTLEPK